MNDNRAAELYKLIEERGMISYTVTYDLFADAMDRIARKIEHDGELAMEAALAEHGFVRVRTCRIVKEKRMLRSMIHGECEVVDERCSECGGYMEVGLGVIRNYCPNCGAKVARQ